MDATYTIYKGESQILLQILQTFHIINELPIKNICRYSYFNLQLKVHDGQRICQGQRQRLQEKAKRVIGNPVNV